MTNAAGLPNLIGSVSTESNTASFLSNTGNLSTSGVFTATHSTRAQASLYGAGQRPSSLHFDASSSSSIYGNSNTIMPASIDLLAIIYLGK